MAIVVERFVNFDGRELIKTMSDAAMKIERDGVRYDEAVDPADAGRIYTETGEQIEGYEPVKYSVVSIIEAMRGLGKYEEFRAMLESERLDWDFVGANYMAENHPLFVRMCSALVESGIVTKVQIDELLPKCIWSAD